MGYNEISFKMQINKNYRNGFGNTGCETSTILFRPQCVKHSVCYWITGHFLLYVIWETMCFIRLKLQILVKQHIICDKVSILQCLQNMSDNCQILADNLKIYVWQFRFLPDVRHISRTLILLLTILHEQAENNEFSSINSRMAQLILPF